MSEDTEAVWRVGMNISRLRELIRKLPDSFDPTELTESHAQELCDELEELLGTVTEARRKADETALAIAEKRVAELRVKLSIEQSQKIARVSEAARQPSALDETDAGNGVGIENDRLAGTGADAFRDELASLRERTQQKRRRG